MRKEDEAGVCGEEDRAGGGDRWMDEQLMGGWIDEKMVTFIRLDLHLCKIWDISKE
jgi:hypothetical protein